VSTRPPSPHDPNNGAGLPMARNTQLEMDSGVLGLVRKNSRALLKGGGGEGYRYMTWATGAQDNSAILSFLCENKECGATEMRQASEKNVPRRRGGH
jgi:NAD dependent epimerase/dehydratase family enzyme